MIVITGAAGFIGSALVAFLNEKGYTDLVLVDDFSHPAKAGNWGGKRFRYAIHREQLFAWLEAHQKEVTAIFHMGARTNTLLLDEAIFYHLNLAYSQRLWTIATQAGIPFFYASSAATYGDGALGFSDEPARLPLLQPLNPYAQSKHQFDLWVHTQHESPPQWAGFKFFNVYGPNEYHKGAMVSVAFKGLNEIVESGTLKLFRSYRPDYPDGGQKRDFIYVRDVVAVLYDFWVHKRPSGLYNLGTGQAETFLALGEALFEALGRSPNIEFIDMPPGLAERYQYFTEADLTRLRKAGCRVSFTPLADGIAEYVKGYLYPTRRYW